MIKIFLPEKFNVQAEYEHIISEIKRRFSSAGGFVLGISGGKDSSVAAKLFCDAIGAGQVHGLIMPNGHMKDQSFAVSVCEELGISYNTVDISSVYAAEMSILSDLCDVPDYAAVNILPRIRMMTLYAVAHSMGRMVLGTGNLSEATVGYCTKWGDMASDFNPIAMYTCSEVIELGRHILPGWIAEKEPEDGLWGKTDEDNLGFTYYELDRYIRLGERSDNTYLIEKKQAESAHKRSTVPNITPLF